MQKNKKFVWLIVAMLVIILLIVLLVIWKSMLGTDADDKVKLVAPADNSVVCNIDGKKELFKMVAVNYFSSTKTTTFLATGADIKAGEYTTSIQLSFPGQTVGSFVDDATSSNFGIHYGVSTTESYQSFFENGPTNISITRYEGNNIAGSFTGTGIFIDMNGSDATRKHIFDCSFTSSLAIQSL